MMNYTNLRCLVNDCECQSHNGFLTRRGYEAARRRGVDKAEEIRYLDSSGSVSGLRRDETEMIFCEEVLDEQHRRFLNCNGEA